MSNEYGTKMKHHDECGHSCSLACPFLFVGNPNWRLVLLVTSILSLLGSTVLLIYVAVTMRSPAGNPMLGPTWFYAQIGFASAILALSAYGAFAATKSAKRIHEGHVTPHIFIVYILVLIFFVSEMVLAMIIFGLRLQVLETQGHDFDAENPLYVDTLAMTWATSHSQDWVTAQTYMKCCGYTNTTGVLATGFLCSNPSLLPQYTPCRPKVMNLALSKLTSMGSIGLVVAFMLLAAVIAGTCLNCCMHPTSEKLQDDESHLVSASDSSVDALSQGSHGRRGSQDSISLIVDDI